MSPAVIQSSTSLASHPCTKQLYSAIKYITKNFICTGFFILNPKWLYFIFAAN